MGAENMESIAHNSNHSVSPKKQPYEPFKNEHQPSTFFGYFELRFHERVGAGAVAIFGEEIGRVDRGQMSRGSELGA